MNIDAISLATIAAAVNRPVTGVTSDLDLNRSNDGDLPRAELRPAAVLIGLIAGPTGFDVMLTKRSSHLKNHPGQIALPGGKVESADADVVAAALRESFEEIALPAQFVDVLGTLPVHTTITGFAVTPVVAHVRQAFTPIPERGEVDEVFRTPLAHLVRVKNYRVEGRMWRGVMRRYYVVPYGPYYIWGATARILRAFADRFE